MALIHCNFFSHALGVCASMDVILPQPQPDKDGQITPPTKKYPVLYLLHGHSDDHTIWQRRTAIERYVETTNLAVVMPAVNLSFYCDMAVGPKYWTFISEELPVVVRSFFPISAEREDNFVAGLSMGGFGAFKLALNHPERYCAAASLSGALDMIAHAGNRVARPGFKYIFGPVKSMPESQNDLFCQAKKVAESEVENFRLYQWCGKDDFLYQENIKFRDFVQPLGLDLAYSEGPGGHEWVHWDRQIRLVIKWLGFKPGK